MTVKRTFLRWYLLFLVSGLSLFLEMAVIRWISAEVRLFSYFKNLALLAAFLGLAIGFGVAGRERDYRRALAPTLAALIGGTAVIGRITSPRLLLYPGSSDEFLWFTASSGQVLDLLVFISLLLLFFLLIVFLFIPLGQATGKEMLRHSPVPAYIVNLLASLAGIWLFALLSFLQTPPALWFGLAMLGIVFYLSSKRLFSWLAAGFLTLALAGLILLGQDTIWSPYHRLDIVESYTARDSDGKLVEIGYGVAVQQIFYQQAVDLSEDTLTALDINTPTMADIAFSYNLPYLLGPEDAEVLIVGAGMGNDVAAALRNNASHIDAVEIDPAILKLGHELHPEAPYQDPRVTAIVDDARAFFEKNSERYDVVAFGLLDSHTLLSGLSNIRLDSFVYTLDSFEQVREHLTEDGLVSVTFYVGAPWIEQRLGQMLIEVFGSERVYVHYGGYGTTFVAGSVSPDRVAEYEMAAWQPDPTAGDVPLTTDDWPYLYLRTRKVPAVYWQALLVIGLVCLAFIARTFPEALRPQWHFWFLGAAFLLIEFKSITELALLFGTTWLVNVLAVSGVLLMALAANIVVLKRQSGLDLKLPYGLLFASLALNYFLPPDLLVGLSPTARAMGSMVLLSLPLFFAGLIFSESLRRAKEAAGPMASNLSGSVAGGVLEYGALIWGVKNLYIVAGMLYAAALLASLKKWRRL
jgi:hypothetical protein